MEGRPGSPDEAALAAAETRAAVGGLLAALQASLPAGMTLGIPLVEVGVSAGETVLVGAP